MKVQWQVNEHKLDKVAITFHGGEPLLAGFKRLESYLEIIRATIPCEVEIATQTNATLLDEQILDLFAKHHVRIGISIDGAKEVSDRHRRFRNGRSSFERVINGINLVRSKAEWRQLLGGYLAVIDLRNNPRQVFSFLKTLRGRGFDILLPDSNYEAPPPRPQDDFARTAYGRWMADFFDAWMNAGEDIEVRYFEEIMAMLFGQESSMEAIGARSVDLVVVEADGGIEAVDTLKMVSRSATNLGLDVWRNTFDEALQHPAVYSRLVGFAALCHECQECKYLNFCGGGYLPHRYSACNGFQNPSIYCTDIMFLVDHIKKRLRESMVGIKSERTI